MVVLNTPPVAEDVAVTGDEDSLLTASFDADDIDIGDTPSNLTYVITSPPMIGSVTNHDDGTFTYDPGSNFQSLAVDENQEVPFTYSAADTYGDSSNTATVTITINGLNDEPIAVDDEFDTDEDTAITTGSVLPNDSDIDSSDVLTVAGIDVSGTSGDVIDHGDGTFSYDPSSQFQYLAVGETATDSFSYTVSDGNGGSDTGAVTISVSGVNDAPQITELNSEHDDVCQPSPDGQVAIAGQFTDLDLTDTHTVTVTWGDESGSETLANVDQVSDTFASTHNYDQGGVYTVTVTVTDPYGVTSAATTTAVVSGVGLVENTLYLIGTEGEDKVDIKLKPGANQVVNAKVELDKKGDKNKFDVDFVANEINEIVIFLCGGDDDAHIHNNVSLNTVINGGDGDDQITGGDGHDVLIGGAGQDKLKGQGGDDSLLGEDGNDDLDGNEGNDILIGGQQNDKLTGGKDRDLLIGGLGADDLKGGEDDDILIGGITEYDESTDTLDLILAEWNSGNSYDDRRENIAGTGSTPITSPLIMTAGINNVFDDSVEDKIHGNGGRDWFFADHDEADEDDDDVRDKKNNEELELILDLL